MGVVKRKKTILITGINGFLGSHLAKTLLSDFNIIGLEYDLENLKRIKEYSFKIYSSKGNLENIFKENEIFAIIHAATVYGENGESIENLINTNVILPIKLYELANNYNTQKFLNTDSFFNKPEYGYSYLADYTLSKRQVLEWLNLKKGGCELVNMKLFHLYGDGDAPNKFVPLILSTLQKNQPFLELTMGLQRRDFVFIDDVAKAYLIVLKNFKKHVGQISEFEVGTGLSISIREFIELAKKLTQSHTELKFGALPYRKNEIMVAVADNRKLLSLGWKHQYTLIEGLTTTIRSICQ